ncbi:MAG TPA: hypothetical protein VK947_03925 [Planococcus sp. (in: firmicutes)]|nr:hypothetical protein [Planococcus sp. (in: firmicutes)]
MKRVQKGICMEVKENRSVFMLGDGQFVHGEPVGTTGIGEESLFYPVATKSKLKLFPIMAPALAAVAVLVLMLTAILPQGNAYAYVQVQVNPGVEIGMDQDKQVISVRELNEDGRKLIEELGEWENHSLEEILNRVLELAPVESADELTITTVSETDDSTIGKVVEKTVLAATATSLNRNMSILLKTASQKQRAQAVKENIPVGQLVKESKQLTNHAKPEKGSKQKEPPGLKKHNEDPPLSDIPPVKTKQEKQPQPAVKDDSEENGRDEKQEKNPPGQEKKNLAPGQIQKQENPPTGQEKKKGGTEKQQPDASESGEKENNGNKENKGNKGNGNQKD